MIGAQDFGTAVALSRERSARERSHFGAGEQEGIYATIISASDQIQALDSSMSLDRRPAAVERPTAYRIAGEFLAHHRISLSKAVERHRYLRGRVSVQPEKLHQLHLTMDIDALPYTRESRPFRGRPIGAVKSLLRVFERWHIDEASAARALGDANPDFISDLRSGASALRSRDARDRARLLLDIYAGVFALLKDPETERTWIRQTRGELGDKSLLGLIAEGSMRSLMIAANFVSYVNGR